MSNTTLVNQPLNQALLAPPATVEVAPARARQTAVPQTPFKQHLEKSAEFLMRGAAAVTSVAGGPLLAAAVHGGTQAASSLAGRSTGGPAAAGLATGMGGETAADAALTASAGPTSELATMQAMQRESQAFNVQLLSLQEDVQNENRRFSTLTNLLRAKHDTAKAAVSNIRS